jgi:glycerol-3-phosphate acyltransferase PlsX
MENTDQERSNIIVAVDAMGGDKAPDSVMQGISLYLESFINSFTTPNLSFRIFGDARKLEKYLDIYPNLKGFCEIIHAEDEILPTEKPSLALRKLKTSSMGMGIKSLKEENPLWGNKKSSCFISSGNTGAMMAMGVLTLRTLNGIARPAICSIAPTMKKDLVFLDLGANAECSEQNLFEFALMAEIYARKVLKLSVPKIGLLNIGTEEEKGTAAVKQAAKLLQNSYLAPNYIGFVEGTDLGKGEVDIIVTDGFCGNIALKTMEGTAKVCGFYIKEAFNKNFFSKIAGLIALPALKVLKNKIDPRNYNGAMFLGLDGVIVKSHGSSDALGFQNALIKAISLVENKVNDYIIQEAKKTVNLNKQKPEGLQSFPANERENKKPVLV